ncbi:MULTISPECIES: hypothetical protein [Photobacterium]|uniref:Uncharacterized protein n=2 Tax=Photobacterium angustum TaxID=661 RepID=A0A0D8RIX6_PHOAN|nr:MULTISPECIES: hypothetical protein [Photobacterium]KJF79830.1 hypothetical protein UB36_20585 [Photobacterium damselae subsp. damselae]EAS65490.1 hypothetical protein VAS14_09274 [Photobacterium angustum S14]KJF93933.1 hypothetical protein UB39_13330 [Photobacterium angustum]KJG02205.1 hypothetical protein UB35_08670 [Photobacterium angustum]KJG05107.1 hypothetical protein UB33_15770 [Photobacterium angustum]
MSNILTFPVKEQPRERTPLETIVEQELLDLNADQYMIDVVLERMEKFLALASFEFDLKMKVSKECLDEMHENVFPAISEMQASVRDNMNEILTERVLHEIRLYNLEMQAVR